MFPVGLSEYKIELPSMVCQLLHLLTRSGHQAYVVGGCVRDSLRGVVPKDYDICTSALPEDTIVLCRSVGYDVIPTGLKHGTVTVVTEEGSFEVTTFRVDGEYLDGRHPESVEFTSNLLMDLARRDFTMNAMAYSPQLGLVDPFGGRYDLALGVIRCVGDPMERFREDSLRVLRALRFAAVMDFRLHYDTASAVHAFADTFMSGVSMERIQAEFSKILVSRDPARVLWDYFDVFSQIIPELVPLYACEQNQYHKHDVLEHCFAVMSAVPADLVQRLAALFHDVGKPACLSVGEDGRRHFYGHPAVSAGMVQEILRRLRYPKAVIDEVHHIVLYHDSVVPMRMKDVNWDRVPVYAREFLSKHGDLALPLLNVVLADVEDHADCSEPLYRVGFLDTLRYEAVEQLRGQSCIAVRDLAVSGRDVMECGVPEGPVVGSILKRLVDFVMEDPSRNERDILLAEVQAQLA